MTRLILHLTEHWPAPPDGPAAHWVVLDERDRVLQQGHSEPAHWPAAAHTEVVLGGAQVVWLRTRLPRGARRDERRLLAYALEDRLAGDPDAQHLTVGARSRDDAGQQVDVLVIARSRLKALLAQLQALGRTPTRVVAEVESAPADADGWTLSLGPAGGGWLKCAPADPDACMPLDPDSAAVLITRALAQARAANREPQKLHLRLAPGVQPPDAGWLPAELPRVIHHDQPWWLAARQGSNLLQGEFASAGNRAEAWRAYRWPARLALAALITLALADLGQLVWQRQQLAGLQARIERIFAGALPQQPLIDPPRQLARHADLLRGAQGQLREQDFLHLMQAAADALGSAAPGAIIASQYKAGRLELSLAPSLSADAANAAANRLGARGWTARALAAEAGQPARLILSREPQR